jgi:hypothetical protein
MTRLLLCLVVTACSSETPPPDTSPLRPAGVTICYSGASDELPVVQTFRTALFAADYGARPAALDALKAAAQMSPDDEALALLTGLGNLWRIAEPLDSEASLFITSALTAKNEVERAYQLCPTDHRIPAWLGPILVNMGRQLKDQASIDEGLRVLQQGIDHYPSFVLFSKLLIYADRPAGDPDFQNALAAVEDNIGACGDLATTRDPACKNTVHVPHNVEGSTVFLGDVFAKAGKKSEALALYEGGRSGKDFATWPFRAVLDERVASLDARVAAFADSDASNDPPSAWNSDKQCSYCHQKN